MTIPPASIASTAGVAGINGADLPFVWVKAAECQDVQMEGTSSESLLGS